MNKELAKTLTTALVQWIERKRPEGTVCCSSYECEQIEKAFEGGCYDIVESLIKRKLSGLTEYEQGVRDMIVNALTTVHTSSNGKITSTVTMDANTTHLLAAGLLELARRELLSYPDESNPKIEAMADLERTFEDNPEKLPGWLKDELAERYQKGYYKGRQEALEEYNKSVIYHYNTRPLCWEPGGTCTNPHMDCINCPRQTTGGFNTSSGTSTLKGKE